MISPRGCQSSGTCGLGHASALLTLALTWPTQTWFSSPRSPPVPTGRYCRIQLRDDNHEKQIQEPKEVATLIQGRGTTYTWAPRTTASELRLRKELALANKRPGCKVASSSNRRLCLGVSFTKQTPDQEVAWPQRQAFCGITCNVGFGPNLLPLGPNLSFLSAQ